MSSQEPRSSPLPPYAYIPGGPWPHPTRSSEGHLFGQDRSTIDPIEQDQWECSSDYKRGVDLFNAGYYWEAHEAWEPLWHAHNRRGPTAAVLQGLIKLAAAGVKVRQGQPHGVRAHAARAAILFARARSEAGPYLLGLDLNEWIDRALSISKNPPIDPAPRGTRVSCVFEFRLEPRPRI
jgi:hypothetical protein